MMCEKCGTRIADGMLQCPNCGADIPVLSDIPDDYFPDEMDGQPAVSPFVPLAANTDPGDSIPQQVQSDQAAAVVQAAGVVTNPATDPIPNPSANYAGGPKNTSGAGGSGGSGGPKKGMTVKILSVVLAVAIVASVCVTGFWKPGWFRSKKKPESDPVTSTTPKKDIPKDEISTEQPIVEQNGITVDAGCFDLEGKQLTAIVEDKGAGTAEDGTQYHQYDISLGDQHEFEAPVLLRFPADDPAHTVVTHYDASSDSWVPLATYADKENGGVYVLTRSCSPFRVEKAADGPLFVVVDKGTPKATLALSKNWKNVLMQTGNPLFAETLGKVTEQKKNFVIEVPEVEEDRTPEQAMEAFNEANGWWSLIAPLVDVSVGLVPLEKAPVDVALVNGKFAPFQSTFRADLSEAMTDISILTMGLQVVSDSYQYGFYSDTTALNAYKNLMTNSGTFYSMWTGYGSPALTLGFLGVTIFSMQLDYMISSAKDTQVEITSKVFDSYYKNIHPFDWHYWYDLYVKSFWQSDMNFKTAMDKVNEGIDSYCNEFWELSKDTSNEDFIFAVAESGYKNFFELEEGQKKKLSAEFKADIRKRFAKEVLPKIERFVMERTEEQLRKKCASIVEPFNRDLTIQIKESVDLTTTQMPKYRGCVMAFGRGDKIITKDGWTIEAPDPDDADTDDGWSIDFACTDYGWMCANLPDTLYVYKSKSDMKKKADPLLKVPFDLVTDPGKSRTTVIDLSETHTYGWALTKLTINPNYEVGDPEMVLGWSGDTTQIVVNWKETVDDVEKEYSDITVSFGDYADFPDQMIYATYYDAEVKSPSAKSQDANASVKIGDKRTKLAKEGYYPEGYNGHKFDGAKVIPNPEEGKSIIVIINRGVYSLAYTYTAVPVDEKDSVTPKIINYCKKGFEMKDFMGSWVSRVEEDGKESNGYVKLSLDGEQVKLKVYDDKSTGYTIVLDYKLIDGKKLRLSKSVDGELRWIDITLKDKEHMTMTNNKTDEVLSFTRSKS